MSVYKPLHRLALAVLRAPKWGWKPPPHRADLSCNCIQMKRKRVQLLQLDTRLNDRGRKNDR